MYDIGFIWLDMLITLLGLATCGTLAGAIIWLVDKAIVAKGHGKRTNSFHEVGIILGSPETNQTLSNVPNSEKLTTM